jgi:hypothetical protein
MYCFHIPSATTPLSAAMLPSYVPLPLSVGSMESPSSSGSTPIVSDNPMTSYAMSSSTSSSLLLLEFIKLSLARKIISTDQGFSMMELLDILFLRLCWLLLLIYAMVEPTCYSFAVKIPEWLRAMQVEFNAFLKNHTWALVPSSTETNVVGSKWVLKLKRNADGSMERHKTRLVAKRFHQQARIDYGETFSPVVKPTTIRTVLSIEY